MLSKKDWYGKKGSLKYFIGYTNKTDTSPVPLYIKLPQMNQYVKYFNDNKCMNLLVHDEEFLWKCHEIWDKISIIFKKGLNSKPVYDNRYIKTKINTYFDMITDTLKLR